MDLGVRGHGYVTAGISASTAGVLATDGARLVLVGQDRERAEAAVAKLARTHRTTVTALVGGVSVPGQAQKLVDEAAAVLGSLNGIAIRTGTGRQAHRDPANATDADRDDAFHDILMGTVRSV